jgi:hypothetical protein
MRSARAPEPAPIAKLSQHRRDAEIEAWVCKRLEQRDLFTGVTSTEIRRDRLKVVLLQRGLTHAAAGKFQGKSITWGELFKQLYGAELAA